MTRLRSSEPSHELAEGPVIVAGHAYAGAVIATANDKRVKALVYVAALAPDEGETLPRSSIETRHIQRLRSLLQMRTALSGCRMKGSPTPLPRTPRLSNLHCPGRCSVRFQSRAFRNQPRTGVEVEAGMVPHRGTGPNDQS